MTEIYDEEREHSVRADREAEVPLRPGPRKLTAERLALVEAIQSDMREVAAKLARLVEEEEDGWVPGNPRPGHLTRVDPLMVILGGVVEGINDLERLYS